MHCTCNCGAGRSIAEQHLLLVSTKLADKQRKQSSTSSEAGTVAARAARSVSHKPQQVDDDCLIDLWQQQQRQLDLRPCLQALSQLTSSDTGSNRGNSSRSHSEAHLVLLLADLEEVARQWLHTQLSALQPGTAVCSITAAPAAPIPGGLVIAPGAVTAETSDEQQRERLLLCRFVCSPAGVPHNLPLILQLEGPNPVARYAGARHYIHPQCFVCSVLTNQPKFGCHPCD